MDKIIENRMNRSLLNHGLENLVFEKRQRKTIQQLPQILPVHTQEKKKVKKNFKTTIKKQSSQKNTIQKRKLKILRKSSAKKANKIKQRKQIQRLQKFEESDLQQLISQQSEMSESISIPQQKSKMPKNMKKKVSIQVKQEKRVDQVLSQKKVETQDKKQDARTLTNDIQTKRGRGRPKKDQSESLNNVQQVLKSEQKPLQQIVIVKQNQLIQPQQLVTTEIKIEKVSDSDKDAHSSIDKVNNIRERRAKTFPFKSYNENQDQNYSEDSFPDEKAFKKKKKILKSNRSKASNKPYSLNRIFRKEAKRHFATFSLDLDFNKVSFTNFIKEFGTFDLIHFSLPISYLYNFSEVINLIEKGFVFLWAEKGQTQIGYHLLNRWGFDVIDQIVWVKSNEDQNKIQADNVDLCNSIFDSKEENTKSSRDLFINSKSICLVGYKCPLGNKAEYRTKVSNNIIFAKSLPGMKKPAQIYEIADLMMPGAKKLEFGSDSQKGWLNLMHHQKTLYRCSTCLKEQNLFFLVNQTEKPIQCKKCIVDSLVAQYQTQSIEEITKQYQILQKIPIVSKIYNRGKLSCGRCRKTLEQLQIEGFFITGNSKSSVCIDCFRQFLKKQPIEQVAIMIQKRQVYHQNQLTCSDCGITSILDIYFECNKCKNHIICKKCFWKNKFEDEPNNQMQQESKKLKKQIFHEWRLKFIKNYPLMKFTCFGCKKDLSIPFWCCETCQNWFWCGKCDKGNSEIHPHYQTNEHVEYIMI